VSNKKPALSTKGVTENGRGVG